jgi:hypothetical protein
LARGGREGLPVATEFKPEDRVCLRCAAAGLKEGTLGTVIRVSRHPRSHQVISYFVHIDKRYPQVTFYPEELEAAP